jgi:predicted RNA-binding Zn-ribbon protein involved in translation (DUF1610 family)
MPYKCPKCGDQVHRGAKHSTSAQLAGGLVGALVYACFTAATGNFQCKRCGEIPTDSFSDADRRNILFGSLALGAIAIAVLAGGIALLVAINSK